MSEAVSKIWKEGEILLKRGSYHDSLLLLLRAKSLALGEKNESMGTGNR